MPKEHRRAALYMVQYRSRFVVKRDTDVDRLSIRGFLPEIIVLACPPTKLLRRRDVMVCEAELVLEVVILFDR